MKQSIRKFLEFNGKVIYFLSKDGQYWIAIKPICEALDVNWNRQFQNLKEHNFFKHVFAVQQMRDSKDRLNNMVALPEKYVYGWIFQINSTSVKLAEYQGACCDILYNHFHGILGIRREVINQQIELKNKISDAEKALEQVPEFKALQDLQAELMRTGKSLKDLDGKLYSEQLNLFN